MSKNAEIRGVIHGSTNCKFRPIVFYSKIFFYQKTGTQVDYIQL